MDLCTYVVLLFTLSTAGYVKVTCIRLLIRLKFCCHNFVMPKTVKMSCLELLVLIILRLTLCYNTYSYVQSVRITYTRQRVVTFIWKWLITDLKGKPDL